MTRRKPAYPRLTERETEIMEMLWENGPLFVREMLSRYPDPKPHVNTVSTTVRILETKAMSDMSRQEVRSAIMLSRRRTILQDGRWRRSSRVISAVRLLRQFRLS